MLSMLLLLPLLNSQLFGDFTTLFFSHLFQHLFFFSFSFFHFALQGDVCLLQVFAIV